jgi:hypothetical protein
MRFEARAARWALLAVPGLTIAVVSFAIFVVGAPRSYRYARLYGGPTESQTQLSWRLLLRERYRDLEQPVADRVRIHVARAGQGRSFDRVIDASGSAELSVDLAKEGPLAGPLWIEIRSLTANELLAHGTVRLSVERWRSSARRRGGFLPVKSSGALAIRVAPGRGTLAVPFFDPLFIEVTRDARAVAGARLELQPDGLVLASDSMTRPLTDAAGTVEIRIAPREHVTTLGITAVAPDGRSGRWFATVPVTAGALHAELVGQTLLIRAPAAQEEAFYALVHQNSRIRGGSVRLTPRAHGGSGGSVDIGALTKRPLWAVVSSEPELDNRAAVGWPLDKRGSEPFQLTFDARDHLLLDGRGLRESGERKRRTRAAALAALACFSGAGLVGIGLYWRVRRADTNLSEHLRRAGADPAAMSASKWRSRWTVLLLAVFSIALGFAVVALIAVYRLS